MRTTTAILVMLPLAVEGCLSGFNVLPAANAPLFSEGGELQGTVGTTLKPPCLEANLALSPVDHVGILAGLSWAPVDHGNKHAYGELAVGGYLPLGMWRIELFGGLGYGTSQGRFGLAAWGEGTDHLVGDFTRTFVQIDAGYEASEYFEMGAIYRMGWLTAWVDSGEGARFGETKHQLTGEWVLLFRGGGPMAKVELQILMASRLDDNNEGDFGFVIATLLGVHLAFDFW